MLYVSHQSLDDWLITAADVAAANWKKETTGDGVLRHVSCLETVSRHGFLGLGSVSTLFSERRYMLSPVRPSVVCLSVTFVRPTQAVQIFGNISTALGTLAIH